RLEPAGALSVKFHQISVHLERAKGFFRDGLVAPLRSPGTALVAAAKMNTNQNFRPPLDISNHRIVRSDGRVQRLDGIDAARLQRCPAFWVEEGRIRR